MAKEIVNDPSLTEQEIMRKYNKRLQEHNKRNEERKLTKAQKAEKIQRRLRRDAARETRAAVFRIESLGNGKNLFKINKNA